MGFAGAFPPYDFLVKKFRKAKDFETAFKLRKPKSNGRKAKARNHLHPRWGGDLEWRMQKRRKSRLGLR
jgi:hypothetical protein